VFRCIGHVPQEIQEIVDESKGHIGSNQDTRDPLLRPEYGSQTRQRWRLRAHPAILAGGLPCFKCIIPHPTRTVSIQNFSFKPANITIKRGTKVRWINKDSTTHTVTANKKRSFDSGRLGPGKSYTHTFKSAGKKRYHCNIHPDMRGSVVVKR
jgi:hypothetical protein